MCRERVCRFFWAAFCAFLVQPIKSRILRHPPAGGVLRVLFASTPNHRNNLFLLRHFYGTFLQVV
jgi:hypothetical protein